MLSLGVRVCAWCEWQHPVIWSVDLRGERDGGHSRWNGHLLCDGHRCRWGRATLLHDPLGHQCGQSVQVPYQLGNRYDRCSSVCWFVVKRLVCCWSVVLCLLVDCEMFGTDPSGDVWCSDWSWTLVVFCSITNSLVFWLIVNSLVFFIDHDSLVIDRSWTLSYFDRSWNLWRVDRSCVWFIDWSWHVWYNDWSCCF